MVPAVRLEPPTHVENAQVIEHTKGLNRQNDQNAQCGYAVGTQRRLENFCSREEIFRKIDFVYERAKFAGSPHCHIKNRFRLTLPVAVSLIRKGGA